MNLDQCHLHCLRKILRSHPFMTSLGESLRAATVSHCNSLFLCVKLAALLTSRGEGGGKLPRMFTVNFTPILYFVNYGDLLEHSAQQSTTIMCS